MVSRATVIRVSQLVERGHSQEKEGRFRAKRMLTCQMNCVDYGMRDLIMLRTQGMLRLDVSHNGTSSW